jgi:hypothetical protein
MMNHAQIEIIIPSLVGGITGLIFGVVFAEALDDRAGVTKQGIGLLWKI